MLKKTFLSLLLISIIALCGCSEEEESKADNGIEVEDQEDQTEESSTEEKALKREDADFRNTKWGDSLEDIKKYETATFLDEADLSDYYTIVYKDDLVGYDVAVTYLLYDGKLRQAGYQLDTKYVTPGQYITAYEDIKSKLESIYGTPETDTIDDYSDGLTEGNTSDGMALELGAVEYDTKWLTNNTKIDMDMYAEGKDIFLTIKYWDKSFEPDYGNSGL